MNTIKIILLDFVDIVIFYRNQIVDFYAIFGCLNGVLCWLWFNFCDKFLVVFISIYGSQNFTSMVDYYTIFNFKRGLWLVV